MHPNAFLKTFWQMELRPEVFVAMTFSEDYRTRFEEVIAPAIRSVPVPGVPLEPRRVDESKSGDSILTEIMDGIAHSQMVLADVSTLGNDSKSGRPYRNGNVMYEVGIALACRQPQEVLLVRDDQHPFLFDVSTIPHLTLDFTEGSAARAKLSEELASRLSERQLLHDARVTQAISRLSPGEVTRLRKIAELGPTRVVGWNDAVMVGFAGTSHRVPDPAIPRLLDKQLIRAAGEFETGQTAYEPTEFGRVVAGLVASGLRKFKVDAPKGTPSVDNEDNAGPKDAKNADAAGPHPDRASEAEST